jgi:hypothetical protein
VEHLGVAGEDLLGMIRIVKVSPYLRCMAGTNWCRKRTSAMLCSSVGHFGPGGSSALSNRVAWASPAPNGFIFEMRSSVVVIAEHHILRTRTCFAYYEYVSHEETRGTQKAASTSDSVRP